MSLLEFNNLSPKRSDSRKPFKFLVGIGALVGVIALGSTFAANIAINTGAPIEFGQGVAQTTACDDEIEMTPISTFVNGNPDEFKFTGITLLGVDGTDQSNSSQGCAGKSFTIKSFSSSGSQLSETYVLSLDGNGSFISIYGNILATNPSTENSRVTITFLTPIINASDVYTITIESSSATCWDLITCEVGDIGPGGGIIYYASVGAFASSGSHCNTNCHYLEVAPDGWSGVPSDPAQSWSLNYSEATGQELTLTTNPQSGFSGEADNWFIGKGMSNSILIANQPGHGNASENAAIRALAYAGNDSSAGQWYLPAMNELNELCKYGNSQATGDLNEECVAGTLRLGFLEGGYWSSSESLWEPPGVRAMGLLVGNQANLLKWAAESSEYLTRRVRPIRAF
ncbi:MAG: hypothetical protein F2690_04790 [Actinobacteria bacterium]|uniref:Unannotated protein n=1 Tax=freshwater metagenome TaxID=449393 RepID=A0A6J5ZHW4_9ZZZZ|nr:hypothetical protein [Actinomycetota bacterium]MSX72171.1 hypothetical protein [Actinomycetota bacterium]MSY69864.1 hypothetical protein [Actinomycetota bacterium]MTA76584.1 hypothetical protein [Actinomycetota bacterium]